MRLTSFTDYGLRMLMRMASAPERAFSTAELADEFGLSRNHLAKIMQSTIVGCCRLKARLRSAEAAFLADLDCATLADVALARVPATGMNFGFGDNAAP